MSDAARAWRRVSRGLYFVGFGVLLLLTTHDVIAWSFWIEAVSWWPVLLVALGIRMIFEKSGTPWIILLSPLLVFTTLTWLAMAHPAGWQGDWSPVVAESPSPVDRWAFRGRMAMVSLDIRGESLAPGRLVEGRVAGGRRSQPRIRLRDGEARVDLSGWRVERIGLFWPGVTQSWDLGLTTALPLDLDLKGAFTEGDVDVPEAALTRVDLEGAFHHLRFRLGRPSEDVRFDIDGAFNDIEIDVPPDTPVTVATDGALNFVQGRPERPSAGAPGYRLRVHGFMNHVEVRSDPDAPRETRRRPPPGGGADGSAAPAGS